MERLIGSVLTTQQHTNMFYEHELARHSLIAGVHQLHRVGFLSILQKIDRNELPGWGSDKCDTWEEVRGSDKQKKKKERKSFPPGMWNKWVWRFLQ